MIYHAHNVKMPTIAGISTFISMINKTYESLKARKVIIFQCFSFYEQLKFVLSWVEHEKSFIISGPAVISSLTVYNIVGNTVFE